MPALRSRQIEFDWDDEELDADGAEGGTRTPTGYPIRPSNVRVYQFHHFGVGIIIEVAQNPCQ